MFWIALDRRTQMYSKDGAPRRVLRKRRARVATLAIGLSSGLLACSVYDESLRQGSELAPVGAGGGDAGGSASAGTGGSAGGGAGVSVGGDLVDAGASGDSGELPTAGAAQGGGAGAANGGTAGVGASGGTAGMSTSEGGGGATGTAGAAGAAHELGIGKPTSAFTQQPANPSASGNDGQLATRWSATTAALPQWWRVDLGASHLLTQVSLQFENGDRMYTYSVDTSQNDTAYTTQATVTAGVGAVQVVSMPANVSARFVRITVTATVPGVDAMGNPRPTWASFWEVSVLGT